MIRGLLTAEFRKIFSVSLWWALLLPVVLLSFGAGWLGTALGSALDPGQRFGGSVPIGLLMVSMATNFSTLFALVFGLLAVSAEHGNKSITTTYLTGNPRAAVLGAKLLVYLGVGLLYGLSNVVFASAGGLLGAGFQHFGNVGDWFAVCGAGVLSMVLWTLLGVGFGALVTQPTVAILALLGYRLVFESVVYLSLLGSTAAAPIAAYLPAASGNGITGNLAVSIFVQDVTGQPERYAPQDAIDLLHVFFGGTYAHPWWLSLTTFVGYAAVFVVLGWLVGRRRDIT